MPSLSIYLSDDDAEWLTESIGKGNISPYIATLISKDKGRVNFEEDKKTFEWILNLALLFIGLAFILLVVGTNFFPGIGSFGYVVVLLSGGVLLTMQSVLKIQNGRKVKNGTYNSPVG
jgi:hypothetical protein